MMEGDKQYVAQDEHAMMDAVDFRHLGAFQEVYQERRYALAGQDMSATRKSILRMMRNLERSFGCLLFNEGLHGELVPSAFADRLYNDLRFLNVARQQMNDHISAILQNGRVLHIGCSTAVFRTREFRKLFREIQTFDGIRVSYSSIGSVDAGKALVSGHCDLYIGCWSCTTSRYVIQSAGLVSFRFYRRGSCHEVENPTAARFVVSLDGRPPDIGAISGGGGDWQSLDESQWLHWLDHPEKCTPGTVILGPDVQINSECWQPVEGLQQTELREPINFGFLRHHPYEFLSALVMKVRNNLHIQ